MVWGLEKLWSSGSSTQQPSMPTSNTQETASSTSTRPVITSTVLEPSQSTPTASSTTTLSPRLVSSLEEQDSGWFSARSRKQFTLFAAGATFLLISSRLTRRQLAKRVLKTPPTFKQNSAAAADIPVNGPIEAVEALSIATINVLSFTMMMSGGLMWAFDISSLDDLRRLVRGGLGVDGSGRTEGMVEEEFEEWLATVLERKKGKEEEKAKGKASILDDETIRERWRNERGKDRTL